MATAAVSTRQDLVSTRAGTLALVLGALFLAAVAYTFALSLSAELNPPHWVRVAGLVWLPIGFFGTPLAYGLARLGAGRTAGRVGLLLMAGGLAALVGLLFAVG